MNSTEHTIEENWTDAFLSAEDARSGAPASAPGWSSAPLTQIVEHLRGMHHAYLKRELPLLEQFIAHVIEVDGHKHGTTLVPLRKVFQHFKQELAAHMRAEESILFPALMELEAARGRGAELPQLPFGSVLNPIRMLMMEHETTGWELDEMREITLGYDPPPDACESYCELYRRLRVLETEMRVHIDLENNILFPRAARLEKREFRCR